MKRLLSIVVLLSLLLSTMTFNSFADCSQEPYKALYEEQRRINDMDRWDRKVREYKEDSRNERKEKLELDKFKSEEAWKKCEAANSNVSKTYAQLIEANPCMKDAIEDIHRVVYSADSDDVRKTIFKLESERKALKEWGKSLSANSESTVGQLENINNRLQAIDYELNILNRYNKKLFKSMIWKCLVTSMVGAVGFVSVVGVIVFGFYDLYR